MKKVFVQYVRLLMRKLVDLDKFFKLKDLSHIVHGLLHIHMNFGFLQKNVYFNCVTVFSGNFSISPGITTSSPFYNCAIWQ